MENRKNTILLTVIAVATLLVAVVGASFAFFAVQQDNKADIKVETTTAPASDIFKAQGTGNLTLKVSNDVMMEHGNNVGDVAVSATTSEADKNQMVVSLEAGSGTATCTYYIQYNAATGENIDKYTMTTDAENGLEYTIEGTDGAQTVAQTNIDQAAKFGPYTIVDTYEETSVATVQTWNFTAKFYNLAIPQTTQIDKTFSGNLSVVDVECTNAK